MDRRTFLGAVTAGVAGCTAPAATGTGTRGEATTGPSSSSSAVPTGDRGTASASGAGRATATGDPLALRGRPADICSVHPDVGADIRAITGPSAAADWSEVATTDYGALDGSSVVVGVERDGAARAYPLSILWAHEAVNDDLGGSLLVTYCSLCYSAVVVERTVAGEPTTFGVTGLLWQPPEAAFGVGDADGGVFGAARGDGGDDRTVERDSNLVLYDAATGSYWSQLAARAICGPRRGERLAFVPAEATTWGDWRRRHPDTDVLLPPPHSLPFDPPYPGEPPPGL